MPRERKTVLFSKNHITLVRYENMDWNKDEPERYEYAKRMLTGPEPIKPRTGQKKVKLVSPLGFYYYGYEEERRVNDAKNWTLAKYLFRYRDVCYELSYYLAYSDTKVGIETRPWEIYPSDKSWEDHYVTDLLKAVDEMFAWLKEKKITSEYHTKYLYDPYAKPQVFDVGATKCDIYTALFGDKDGPKFQTNEEKILAHGFDLKTSFRKM